MSEEKKTKSIYISDDLVKEIQKHGTIEDRSFNAQLIHILKQWLKHNAKKTEENPD